ncbi:cyclin-like protein [Meredithblackwellia eburnea MCA 4105]
MVPTAPVPNDIQWIFTSEELMHTPSIKNGTHPDQERWHRALAVKRLMGLQDLLGGAQQLTVATAAVFLHRFYMRQSVAEYQWHDMSIAAFFLASKVEESSRRLKDVVAASLVLDDFDGMSEELKLRNIPNHQTFRPSDSHPNFAETRRKALFFEEVLLRTLCFDLTVEQPFWVMLKAVKEIWKDENATKGKDVARRAWSFLSDSLVTTTCLLHSAKVIAAASIALACAQIPSDIPFRPTSEEKALLELAREEGEEKDEDKYWLDALGVTPEQVSDAIVRMTVPYDTASDPYVKDEAAVVVASALAIVQKHAEAEAAREVSKPKAVSTESATKNEDDPTALPSKKNEDIWMPDAPVPGPPKADVVGPLNTEAEVKGQSLLDLLNPSP